MLTLEIDDIGEKLVYTKIGDESLGRWDASGMGMRVDHKMTPVEALTLARCDSSIAFAPIVARDSKGRESSTDDWRATIRETDGRMLGVVKSSYTIAQTLDVLRTFVEDSPMLTVIAGLENGDIYCQATLDASVIKAKGGDDVIRNHLTWLIGHSGERSNRFGQSATRAVCENTMTHSLIGLAKIKHTMSIHGKMSRLAASVMAAIEEQRERDATFQKLAETSMSETEMGLLLATVFPGKRNDSVRDMAMARFTGAGTGADIAGRTAWGAYQAVTEELRDRAGRTDGSVVDQWLYNELNDGAEEVRSRALVPLLALAGV